VTKDKRCSVWQGNKETEFQARRSGRGDQIVGMFRKCVPGERCVCLRIGSIRAWERRARDWTKWRMAARARWWGGYTCLMRRDASTQIRFQAQLQRHTQYQLHHELQLQHPNRHRSRTSSRPYGVNPPLPECTWGMDTWGMVRPETDIAVRRWDSCALVGRSPIIKLSATGDAIDRHAAVGAPPTQSLAQLANMARPPQLSR
jgi:hypothetical protein